ncbi:uncharacterized protein PHALS_09054 [Plasmopara halstedii]|uniref:Uncharacterized protein n=1 Tax=Plasmopara halstedii TaxID=4781 RepID=A0A0P1AF11_PLAHL|nr:uncharacterized protein PHALS_09054 [Plasmopara halstedii]CEG38989.1 hypothetical protein PHALS_09054 [Plasmopara halstedii]|eukprot:XP_024575358.1 hypothetical protein PHALS_09054 [Plasmopara halstedii]
MAANCIEPIQGLQDKRPPRSIELWPVSGEVDRSSNLKIYGSRGPLWQKFPR